MPMTQIQPGVWYSKTAVQLDKYEIKSQGKLIYVLAESKRQALKKADVKRKMTIRGPLR